MDEPERWQDAGIDSVNIINQIIPGSYADFIQGVLTELRRRGLAQTEYAPGKLHEKVLGRGPKLEPTHPASRSRGRLQRFVGRGNGEASQPVPDRRLDGTPFS